MDLRPKTPILKPILIPIIKNYVIVLLPIVITKLLLTARPTGLTNTLIIENVNIRHTQLVQALAKTLNQRTCSTREIHSVRPIGLT